VNQSDTRAATFGLLGALIGGAASLGGTYLSVHQTTQAAAVERQQTRVTQQRVAYLDFATKANQYAVDLRELKVRTGQREYARVRARLITEIAPLYTAYQGVLLAGPKNVSDAAGVVQGGLVQVYVPARRTDLSGPKLQQVLDASNPRLVTFTTAASTALADQDG
jgi:hypothetical protein